MFLYNSSIITNIFPNRSNFNSNFKFLYRELLKEKKNSCKTYRYLVRICKVNQLIDWLISFVKDQKNCANIENEPENILFSKIHMSAIYNFYLSFIPTMHHLQACNLLEHLVYCKSKHTTEKMPKKREEKKKKK